MLLVILQNTYEVETDTPLWERLLWRSHTGRRLREMLPDGREFVVTNASKVVGDGVDSIVPPDLEHIRAVIEQVRPSTILACGKVAQSALTEMGVDFIPAPHPAWRCLSKQTTAAIRNSLRRCGS